MVKALGGAASFWQEGDWLHDQMIKYDTIFPAGKIKKK